MSSYLKIVPATESPANNWLDEKQSTKPPPELSLTTLKPGEILAISFKFRDGGFKNRIWSSFLILESIKFGEKDFTRAEVLSFCAENESGQASNDLKINFPSSGEICLIKGSYDIRIGEPKWPHAEKRFHTLIPGWRLDLTLNPWTRESMEWIWGDPIASYLIMR